MSKKKKNIFESLFKSKSGCSCGVTIVEEKTNEETPVKKING